MNNNLVIQKTAEHVKEKMSGEGSGHDWWHVYRVWKNALHINKTEKANSFVIELAALLHDIADWKFSGDEKASSKYAKEWLEKFEVNKKHNEHVCNIIDNISFKGSGVKSEMKSIEGKIVQDADRLDAIGAIGIGRTFAYGGAKQREMYNPEINIQMADTFEDYIKAGQTTINHFYEKLLLLKDLMNTKTAKKIASERHRFMEGFLKQFYAEWEGRK